VQGGAFLPNLGDTTGAVSSFRKAIDAVGPVPATAGLARLEIEADLNIAQLATDPMEGAPDFDRAIRTGEQQLSEHHEDVQTLRLVAQAYHGKATIAHLTDNVPDHQRNVRRAIEMRERVIKLTEGNWQDQIALAREYAQHALAFMQEGDAAAALERLEQGQALLESTRSRLPSNQMVSRGLAEIRSRSVRPLLALNRPSDAAAAAESAIALLAPLVESDRRNAEYQSDLATASLWLADARAAQGRLAEAIELSQRSLIVRRRRAQDSSSMFVPWGFATNLNMVGELLMNMSPSNWPEARLLFVEARDVAEKVLSRAPSFNEVRKELAISYEGLARVAMAQHGEASLEVQMLLERSLATWVDVSTRSVGDRRHTGREDAVQRLLSRSRGGVHHRRNRES
jgi:tetratricopeptide (TPR) repeat protein